MYWLVLEIIGYNMFIWKIWRRGVVYLTTRCACYSLMTKIICLSPYIRRTARTLEISTTISGISLCLRPANERRRYSVTWYVIGWTHAHNDLCHYNTPPDLRWKFKKNDSRRKREELIIWFVASNVPGEGLAPGCARIFVGWVMAKSAFRIYMEPAVMGYATIDYWYSSYVEECVTGINKEIALVRNKLKHI